jgi:cytochrome c
MCHSVTQNGPNGIGPNLSGVVGRKAAGLPGYAYSPALKASSVVWTIKALDAWLTKPQALVPGTKMVIPGITDPADRTAIIEFLRQSKTR